MSYKMEMPQIIVKLMKRLCKNHVQKDWHCFDWLFGLSCSNSEERYCIIFNQKINTITVYYFGKTDEEVSIQYNLTKELSFVDMLTDITAAVDSFKQPLPVTATGLLQLNVPIRITK